MLSGAQSSFIPVEKDAAASEFTRSRSQPINPMSPPWALSAIPFANTAAGDETRLINAGHVQTFPM
jgi:hypothetical protein